MAKKAGKTMKVGIATGAVTVVAALAVAFFRKKVSGEA